MTVELLFATVGDIRVSDSELQITLARAAIVIKNDARAVN